MAKKGIKFSAKYLGYKKWYSQGSKDKFIQFQRGFYTTNDPVQIRVLREDPLVREVKVVGDRELDKLTVNEGKKEEVQKEKK